jgi:hypothetical protein
MHNTLMFCWPCIIAYSYQYSESNVMHVLFSLLRFKGLYIFQALLAHPQEDAPGLEWNSNPGAANWQNTHAIYQVPFV